MAEREREALLARVRGLVDGVREPFEFRYRTDVSLIPRSSDRPPNGRGTSFKG
jgi:hypothetical protein